MKTNVRKRLVVLISGSGTNLQAIADACNMGSIDATIALVISNKKGAYGIQRAKQQNIKTLTMEHEAFSCRAAFDKALLDEIDAVKPDFVVLAGFMRILSEPFVKALEGKLLNIHPSLLPKYRGLNTHKRALESGDREHGVSVHYVTAELDGGPIIAQSKCLINPDDTEISLSAKVQSLEHVLYPTVIQWLCEERLSLMDNDQIKLDQQILPPTGFQLEGINS